MFRKVSGLTKNVELPVTPSTALPERSLVTFTSGKLVAAVAGTLADDIEGILIGAIAATDGDYADDRLVEIEVPVEKNVMYEFDTTGLVATDVGVDVDLADNVSVDRSASAVGVVRPMKVLSATKGQGHLKIKGSY